MSGTCFAMAVDGLGHAVASQGRLPGMSLAGGVACDVGGAFFAFCSSAAILTWTKERAFDR